MKACVRIEREDDICAAPGKSKEKPQSLWKARLLPQGEIPRCARNDRARHGITCGWRIHAVVWHVCGAAPLAGETPALPGSADGNWRLSGVHRRSKAIAGPQKSRKSFIIRRVRPRHGGPVPVTRLNSVQVIGQILFKYIMLLAN